MIQVGDWTFGQTWTNWADGFAWAETVDNNGPVGQPSFCAPRPLLIKYTHKSGKETYSASLEQQGVANSGGLGSTGVADRRIPTITAGWSHREDWGHIALHAMGQYFGVYKPAVAATTTTPYAAKYRYGKMEYTFLVSGDIRLSKADDIIFSFYEGDAQGSYGAGYQSVVFNDTTRTVTAFRTIGWVAGYQHVWSPKYRSNVNVSGLHYKEPNLTGASRYYYYLKSGLSAYANTFVFFTRNLDMGMEYGYERATPTKYYTAVSPDGRPAAHNTNRKFEVSLRARF
jgi:hypothetical protein